ELVIKSGLLYHVRLAQQTPPQLQWSLYVPRPFCSKVLVAYHAQMAHPGSSVTAETIRRNYWWPGLYNDVRHHLARCEPCQKAKANYYRSAIPPSRSWAPTGPRQFWSF